MVPEFSKMIWSASLPSGTSSKSTALLMTSSASGPISGETVLMRKVWSRAFELICLTNEKKCLMPGTERMMQFFRNAFSTTADLMIPVSLSHSLFQ